MTQQELFFEPRVGGKARRTVLQGTAVKGKFEVADIGENFILADICDEGGSCLSARVLSECNMTHVRVTGKLRSSPNNPVKIQIPRPAASLLKPGDELQIDIKKAAGADYWIPISFT